MYVLVDLEERQLTIRENGCCLGERRGRGLLVAGGKNVGVVGGKDVGGETKEDDEKTRNKSKEWVSHQLSLGMGGLSCESEDESRDDPTGGCCVGSACWLHSC